MQIMTTKVLKKTLSIALALLLGGCATSLKNQVDASGNAVSNVDPYETFNRKIFAFNRGVDKVIYRPVAKVYDAVLPKPMKREVNNFFDNVGTVPDVINDCLQGELHWAANDAARLLINTTLGVFGLVDVASHMGLPSHTQDLGLTFARWGSKDTPYIMIPFLGPSTISDLVALPPYYYFNTVWPHVEPNGTRYLLLATEFTDARSNLLDHDKLLDQAFDPYVFMRSAYLQHRAYLLKKTYPVSVKFGNGNGNGNGDGTLLY